MRTEPSRKVLRCAVYTRVSTEHGLEQDFNSLDAQREAAEAFIKSQAHEGWSLIRDRFDDGGFSGGSLERPALQRLLDAVRSRKVDVVVLYKIDRLTRSLTDFAKLVELFDAHRVSFVSVTQSFNTTTSMGRLTLNVLLSFAQFEREVTGERIRDKIAASKRKGIWMGGPVPLGYRVENRKLLIVPEEAETVRLIFARYLSDGSIAATVESLRTLGIRTRQRIYASGKIVGDVPFTKGPLAWLLKNRIYLGEISHRGQTHPGEHEAIVDAGTFAAVQAMLAEQRVSFTRRREAQGAFLAGKLFDHRGRPMSPSWSAKGQRRWRYYASRQAEGGGAITRVAAPAIEQAILEAVAKTTGAEHLGIDPSGNEALTSCIARATMAPGSIEIRMSEVAIERGADATITVPWEPASTRRRREIVGPIPDGSTACTMAAEPRRRIVAALAEAHRYLDELIRTPGQTVDAIALREGCTERSIRRTLSLAFLAPELTSAAIEGRLARGLTLTRLLDLPADWTEQKRLLGIAI